MLSLRRQPDLAIVPGTLLHVYSELSRALECIRQTRAALESCSLAEIKDTHARLSEVSTATESAAMAMLNGLDRTLAMIDQLEAGSGQHQASAVPQALRDEVNQLYTHLQFQDIIAQQLRGVSDLLTDLERRVTGLAVLFDGPAPGAVPGPPPRDTQAYNPDASMTGAPERQAAIDATFRAAGDQTLLAAAVTPPAAG
jgi:chemotaxis regulatin CheY-phosphate phosphatase CheZ